MKPRRYITPSTFTTCLTLAGDPDGTLNANGEIRGSGDHDLTVQYFFTPGTPGRTSGPAEACYPPEGPEIDFMGVTDEEGNSLEDFMSPENWEQLERQICEHEEHLRREARAEAHADRAADRDFLRRFP